MNFDGSTKKVHPGRNDRSAARNREPSLRNLEFRRAMVIAAMSAGDFSE